MHVKPVVMPSILNGHTNGQLPDSILMPIPSGRPIQSANYRMVIPAARAYIAMEAHARWDGIILKPVSTVDTYRSFAFQEAVYLARYAVDGTCGGCKTCTGYGTRCKKRQANGLCPATAACPGTSNHGWGLAIDVGTELDGDVDPEGIDGKTLAWLDRWAWDYGFSWELLPEEPWHIRYCTGDATPKAVNDYWNPPVPPDPPPPSTVDDMSVIKRVEGSTATLNVTGSFATWVRDGNAVNALIYIGLATDGRDSDIPLYALKGLTLVGPVGDYSVEEGPPRRDVKVEAYHFSGQIF